MESLQALCLHLVAEKLESFCHSNGEGELRLSRDLYLPSQACDAILQRRRGFGLSNQFLSIFKDPSVTRLDNVDFSYMRQFNAINTRPYIRCTETQCHPLETSLVDIVSHDLSELNLLGIRLTRKLVEALSQHSHRLRGLHVKASSFNCHCTYNRRNSNNANDDKSVNCCLKDFKLNLQRLQKLSLHEAGPDFHGGSPQSFHIIVQMINSANHLTILDLSKSLLLNLAFLTPENLPNLHTLLLFEVRVRQSGSEETALAAPEFQMISELKTLRRLDISRICEYAADAYTAPDTQSAFENMVENLVRLECLDISGTAFAGDGDSIAWLEGRRLSFLGLLDCKSKPIPCKRANIPADRVSGTANIEQILTCLQTYATRAWLPHVFEPLKALIYQLLPPNQKQSKQVLFRAIKVVLDVMEKNLHEGQVLAAGCSCLTVLLGSVGLSLDIITKRHIIRLVLDIVHMNTNLKLLRCAGDVLDRFKLPSDGYFMFERMVGAMLRMLRLALRREHGTMEHGYMMSQLENIVHPIEPHYKAIVGRLGGIKLLNQVVSVEVQKKNGEHHAPLTIAWQLLYSLADETPENSKLFVKEKGIQLFIASYKLIRNEHVLVDMMGLMGNMTEVADVRPIIMKSEVMDILVNTMKRGYFEKRNSVCCALAHLIADGEDSWTYTGHSRHEVDKLIEEEVLTKWNQKRPRNIEYRTLSPLVRLLASFDCPGVQTYGAWEILNVTSGKPHLYVPMLERDGVITVMTKLLAELDDCYTERCQFVQKVLALFSLYRDKKGEPSEKKKKKLNLADLNPGVNGGLHDTDDDDSDYQPHISDSEDGDSDNDDGPDDDDNQQHHNALIDMLEGNLIQQAVDELEEYRALDFEEDQDVLSDVADEVVVPDVEGLLIQRQHDRSPHGTGDNIEIDLLSSDTESSDEYHSDHNDDFILGFPDDDPDYLP